MFSALKNLFRRRRAERELDAEVSDYAQLLEEENVARGMKPGEARRLARIELGGAEQVKEEVRRARAGAWFEALLRDIRVSARMLRKNPGFALVAILTLALGIGANAAIFSVLESQLWRPLPFPDSERLVDVHLALRENPRQWDVLPERIFRAWRSENHSFLGFGGALYPQARNLTAGGSSERVRVMAVTWDFFSTLQLPPERGRAFSQDEESPGRDREAIVSDALWHSRFGSDPDLVGKQITIDGEAYAVVGIASPRIRFEYFSEEPAIYVPVAWGQDHVLRNLYTIARLAPGVNIEGARAELNGILGQQLRAEPIDPEPTAEVTNLRETWTKFAAQPLYFFAGAVALVLLIACVNTAGLLLARGLARQREFALRSALGASLATLIRQSLVESLLLSLAGSAAGTVLGVWLSHAMAVFIPEGMLPRNAVSSFDTRVLFFAVVISIFSAVVVGVVPGLFAARVDANRVLAQNSRGASPSLAQRRTRTALVAIEVALGLVLLFGAGLFLSSFLRLMEAPRGFDAPGALTFHVALRGDNYSTPEQMQRYFVQLGEKLASLPGVGEVALGSGLPLTGSDLWGNVGVGGRPPAHKYGTYVDVYAVTPNYVDALHMRLLAGRALSAQDTASSAHVTVINRNAAQELFGSEDPLGKVLDFVAQPGRGVAPQPPVQIVGVVENVQQNNANELPFDIIYVPFVQRPAPSAYALLKSDLPRGTLAGAIRAAAFDIDKNQPVYDLKTMDDRVSDSVQGARFNLYLAGGVAFSAMLLVAVGIFGTVSYFVQQRTQEFGIRLALGASRIRVLRHAVEQALAMGLAGLGVGVAISLALGKLLRHALYLAPHQHVGMLYGVSIYDPLTMSIACGLLLAVLLLASYVPARRAMKVDPMVALRYE